MTDHDPAAVRRYQRLVRTAQRDARVPAVQAALRRSDRPLWTFEVGEAGGGVELGPTTRFRIGSITKTFTAVLVLQCRDEGLLDLDDPISAHLEVPKHGELTIRRLLSHTSGVQREPYGDMWDTLATPGVADTLAGLERAERVLPPGRRFHYSNLGFGLLGQVVAARRRASWAEVLADRILRPLRLDSLSVAPGDGAATGYLVDAFSDHALPEPRTDVGAIAPAAQLWGSAADLASWGAFLADPAELDPKGEVLAADTVDEMRWPATVRDEQLWMSGFGLGLIVRPHGGRVADVGHGGAMPGFLAEAFGRRGPGVPAGTGAAVLLSSGTGADALGLTFDLLDAALELDPPDVAPWRIGEAAPEALRGVLGYWWGEGFQHVFSWHDGHLEAREADAPAGSPPAVFAVEGPDLLRAVAGREVGEQLRLTRDGAGRVTELHWATYRFSRDQETFDRNKVSEP
jgi:CubicO group peptidase (beta-lactamase class C family)